jgi:hypothetical protein
MTLCGAYRWPVYIGVSSPYQHVNGYEKNVPAIKADT